MSDPIDPPEQPAQLRSNMTHLADVHHKIPVFHLSFLSPTQEECMFSAFWAGFQDAPAIRKVRGSWDTQNLPNYK